MTRRRTLLLLAILAVALVALTGCAAQTTANGQPNTQAGQSIIDTNNPQNVSAAIQILILVTVLSLAPAILVMVTSFTRIIVVLSLVRNAIGIPQLPPNQVLIGLALFLTAFVMAPAIKQINKEAVQ
ncbi:MAG: flagellar type III secretion system pore protein FliP, partial [Tepidiformaceae bacterium]